jgi:hypothetical protein
MQNLDYLAAKYGQQMIAGTQTEVKQMENNITSALSILHTQGLYAMFLWLHAKTERHPIGNGLNQMFRDSNFPISLEESMFDVDHSFESLTAVGDNLTSDLKTMIFAATMINQALTYARHSAKAK